MKKIGLLFVLVPVVVQAQIRLEKVSVAKVRSEVQVGFEVRAPRGAVRGHYKMICRPFLYNGADTAWLPSFEVYSKTALREERQQRLLATGVRSRTLAEGEMLSGTTMAYAAQTPYQPWMRTATLSYKSDFRGCLRCKNPNEQTVAENIRVYAEPVLALKPADPDPRRFEVTDAHRRLLFEGEPMKVDFAVAKTFLDVALYDNHQVLDRIMASLHDLQRRSDRAISAVEIHGFASPEGGATFNRELAGARAEALKRYIRDREPSLTSEQFVLVNGDENWEGLRRAVAASTLRQKADVLAILDADYSVAERKARLHRLDNGDTYRYLLRTVYPRLRNACYISVYYDVLGDPAADKINAAQALIREREYRQALAMLEPLHDDPRAFNAIGGCYLMLDNEPEAILWFRRAAAAGDKEAQTNLNQLQ